jgi:PAS domain S-box-containing protein
MKKKETNSINISTEKTAGDNKAIEALERRENIANMLNKVAISFLSQSKESFEAMMTDGVRLIADMIKLDRASIWRNFEKPNGLHASQIYRWDREAGGTTTPTDVLKNVAYSQLAPNWEALLASGSMINSPVRLLPKQEAESLKRFGVVSAFVTPIFLNEAFWGFVLFEDRQNERFFEDELIELLRSAAFLCANTVIRADMEQKITSVNEFNRATLDAAPIGFTIFDENMKIIDANNAILNIFGCDKKYYIEHFFDLAPEFQPNGDNSLEKITGVIKRTLNGESFVNDWSHRTPSGELIPFEITLTRTIHMGKNVVLCYLYDLRHIRQMTEELEKQSKLTKIRLEQQELVSEISRSFVSSDDTQALVKEAIAKLGRYYKVTNVVIFNLDYKSGNAAIEYHWSKEGKEINRKGINTQDLVKASFPERLYHNTTVPILSSNNTSVCNLDISGELLSDNIHAFICAPLYVEGRLWGVMAVEQGDEPRQWTDSEKSFVAMTASTIAGAITLDIYNTKLKDAVTEVTAASKAKSEFLSNMSHEMRTPMNAIINMTVIAKNSSDIERKEYALDKIGDASTHLLGVINDILDMSKIEANKFELVPVEFNFEKMLGRVVNVLNFRVEEKHQKMTVQIDKKIPKILIGDDQRISQVITNLLSNAVKFTPEEGFINLDAKFLEEEKDVCTIQISISDTGVGISKDQQKHLFQSFHQAESSTARKYGGTGLGLSISKSFVEMMGGKIWIESDHGKGSTFAFTIQVKRSKEKKEPKTEEKREDVNRDFSGHRILLAEDMEINREIVLMLLESTNLEIDCAENGLQAVAMFTEEPKRYEMIFMDVHMPEIDGYEATRRIRLYEKEIRSVDSSYKPIPIIAMTANVFKEDIDNCLNAGMNDHVGKPLDFEMIMRKLCYYLTAS